MIDDEAGAKAHIKAIENKAGKHALIGATVAVLLWSFFFQGWAPLTAVIEWVILFFTGFVAIRGSEMNKLKELAIVRAAREKRS